MQPKITVCRIIAECSRSRGVLLDADEVLRCAQPNGDGGRQV